MTTHQQTRLQPVSWYERRALAADSVIAAVCFPVALGYGLLVGTTGYRPLALFVILLAQALLLVIRRTAPEAFVLGNLALAAAWFLVGQSFSSGPIYTYVLVAVHTAARYCDPRFARRAVAAVVVATLATIPLTYVLVHYTSWGGNVQIAGAIFFTALIAGANALGKAQLARRAALDAQMAALAERNYAMQLEQEQRFKTATEEERGRIAAETHDILAHSLAIIVAQADGAAMQLERDPQRAREAVEQIGETGREALAEIRLKVAALRRGEDPSADLAPAKGMGDLSTLFENVRRTGVAIETDLDPELASLPPGLSLAVYRVVQEALTNVMKHAGPNVTVRAKLNISHGALHVSIVDDGRGVTTVNDGSGNGLRGMQSRVAPYGGSLNAGPLPGGGFAVHATIPLAAAMYAMPQPETERTP